MAFTPYTGKSAGAAATFAGTPIPPWKEIRIQEDGKPQTGTIDTTDADSTAYEFVPDPLGGKGTPKTTVTISGNLSKQDYADSGLTSWTAGATGTLIFRKGAGAGKDEFTLAAEFKGLQARHPHAEVVGYTLRFEANAAGAWAATSS
jgi:hypothetical protein